MDAHCSLKHSTYIRNASIYWSKHEKCFLTQLAHIFAGYSIKAMQNLAGIDSLACTHIESSLRMIVARRDPISAFHGL